MSKAEGIVESHNPFILLKGKVTQTVDTTWAGMSLWRGWPEDLDALAPRCFPLRKAHFKTARETQSVDLFLFCLQCEEGILPPLTLTMSSPQKQS